MGALAAGGIAAGLLVPAAGSVLGNIITAGHLVIEINHGQGSSLSVENLAPGEHRTGDQLITADMTGIGTAKLDMSLSEPASTPFTTHATLSVSYSDPQPESGIHWGGGDCSPSGGYTHTESLGHLDSLSSQSIELGVLTAADTAVCVRYDIGLDASAGNDVQAATGGFSMDYTLTQTSAAAP